MGRAPDELTTPEPAAADEVARLVEDARAAWGRRALFESEGPLLRARELAESALGADHPLVAVVLSHLGWLAAARGRHPDAVPHYRRALAIREARLGPDHPETLRAAEELSAALFEVNARDEEADALALRALAAYEAAGRDDADVAGLIATLGWRRYWVGRYAEAEPLLLRALALRGRLLGPGDPATADTAQKLAIMYDHRGFDVDPEPFYRKALAGFEEALPDDRDEVAEARYRLADFLHRRGRDGEAAPLFDRLAATLGAGGPGIDPLKRGWMLGGCCQFLRDAGRAAEAEALGERAGSDDVYDLICQADVARAREAYGPDSPELAEALGHLANHCAFHGRADEAEAAARRALEILRARLGPDDPAAAEAAARLDNIRAAATAHAPGRPLRFLPDRTGDEPFDLFTFPWRDERRPDLIRAFLAAVTGDDPDDPTGAVGAVTFLTVAADADEQWDVIRELIAEAPDDDRVLQAIAAGPLEGFLGRFDAAVIDRVEDQAGRDPKFRRVLSGVWQHLMSDPVWERVRALQATVPDPLPEMRPFAAGDDRHVP